MRRLLVRSATMLLAALLLGAAAVTLKASPAFACSCAGLTTARALSQSDAVFRGTVTSAKEVGRGKDARTDFRFAVTDVYKGTVFADQVVASNPDTSSCGLSPAVGSTWIIFATEGLEGSGNNTVERLTTGLCSGNVPDGVAPTILGRPHRPLDGPSDRAEQSENVDRGLTRGLAIAGIGVLFVGAVVAIGLVWVWRPKPGT